MAEDPTRLLDRPHLPRSVPKALSESQVEALLRADAGDAPAQIAQRTMIELMYACGLRVSELVGLPAAAVNLRQGLLRVVGKGGKERLVPMGEVAQDWLQRYLQTVRPVWLGKRSVSELAVLSAGSSAGPASSSGRPWPASIRAGSVRMYCGTRSPPICSTTAPTCAPCRCCSATVRCRLPRSIP